MKIEKLEIRNFGKMQNRTLEFSDGIQLISGENESGKSTVHTFIRSMLFGMTRGRGRAAKNDVYSRYEPWENPAYYAGEMVLESGGKRFRLTRNFGRQNANAKLVCLTDGEVLSVEDGDLSMLLGGVSEIVYDNTASIGQLKGRTEEGLADELRNYMANYQGSSDDIWFNGICKHKVRADFLQKPLIIPQQLCLSKWIHTTSVHGYGNTLDSHFPKIFFMPDKWHGKNHFMLFLQGFHQFFAKLPEHIRMIGYN